VEINKIQIVCSNQTMEKEEQVLPFYKAPEANSSLVSRRSDNEIKTGGKRKVSLFIKSCNTTPILSVTEDEVGRGNHTASSVQIHYLTKIEGVKKKAKKSKKELRGNYLDYYH